VDFDPATQTYSIPTQLRTRALVIVCAIVFSISRPTLPSNSHDCRASRYLLSQPPSRKRIEMYFRRQISTLRFPIEPIFVCSIGHQRGLQALRSCRTLSTTTIRCFSHRGIRT
jgi:hypothetical protein